MPDVTGPIIQQGPITLDPPKNLAMGAAITALPNAGFGMALQGMDPMAVAANTGMAAFLNFIVAQPIKNIKQFPENKLLTPVMFLVSLGLLYWLVFNQEVGKAFLTAATSTATAIANYKADKAAGTNLMAPVAPEKEFNHVSTIIRSNSIGNSGPSHVGPGTSRV